MLFVGNCSLSTMVKCWVLRPHPKANDCEVHCKKPIPTSDPQKCVKHMHPSSINTLDSSMFLLSHKCPSQQLQTLPGWHPLCQMKAEDMESQALSHSPKLDLEIQLTDSTMAKGKTEFTSQSPIPVPFPTIFEHLYNLHKSSLLKTSGWYNQWPLHLASLSHITMAKKQPCIMIW